ncbi:hypothetical protein KL953_29415 [Mycolicibacterium goodii]|uniref:hypothetical protein n=1 Tax=Mycolicibacterium goodii TaxID=134601 RepID=UPI001BDD8982|nr:hypothetical protein [Mycolicibacterium goodii]
MRWSNQRTVSRAKCIRTTIFHAGPYTIIADVGFATAAWVDWHNDRRLHSSIAVVPPNDFRTLYYAALNSEEQPTMEAAQNFG